MTYSLYSSDLVAANELIDPPHLVSFGDLQEGRVRPPKSAGLYAWWFSAIPPSLPKDRVWSRHDHWLLYVGIGPRAPSSADRASLSHLYDRLSNHCGRRCSQSTLRFSLAALLREELGLVGFTNAQGKIELKGDGERRLSDWMKRHASVSWVEHLEPWHIEDWLIAEAANGEPRLPLNIKGARDPFRWKLKARRAALKRGGLIR